MVGKRFICIYRCYSLLVFLYLIDFFSNSIFIILFLSENTFISSAQVLLRDLFSSPFFSNVFTMLFIDAKGGCGD